jgi:phage FluMu protein Com
MIDRSMIGMTRPTSANVVQLGGGPKKPPQDRFAGPINWSCAFCGAVLVQGVSEVYAEHAIPCYRCGEWNRTPYPDEQR